MMRFTHLRHKSIFLPALLALPFVSALPAATIRGTVTAINGDTAILSVTARDRPVLNGVVQFSRDGRQTAQGRLSGFDRDGHALVKLALSPQQLKRANLGSRLLCAKCSKLMFTCDTGRCTSCSTGTTTSGMHKLCPACARAQGRCMHCKASIGAPAKPLPVRVGDHATARQPDDGTAWGEPKWGYQVGLVGLPDRGGKACTTFPSDRAPCIGVRIARASQNPFGRDWQFAFTCKETGATYMPNFQPRIMDAAGKPVDSMNTSHPAGATRGYRVCFGDDRGRGFRKIPAHSRAAKGLPPGRYDVVMSYGRDTKSGPLAIEIVPSTADKRLQTALETAGISEKELLTAAEKAGLAEWQKTYKRGRPICVTHGDKTIEPVANGWTVTFRSPKTIRWKEEIVVELDRAGKTVRNVSVERITNVRGRR